MPSVCLDENELLDYISGTPSPERRRRVVDHVSSCDACRQLLGHAARELPTRAALVDTHTLSMVPPGPGVPLLQVVAPSSYEVKGEHARGGIGRILRAEDRRLQRPVAVKELISDSDGAALRFMREAVLTARLQHPSIVPVYEAGRWPDGRPFYAMKFVSGKPLSELIAAARTLDQRIALLPHAIAVAEAIAYAHSQRVIHRDLKPSNVVVGEFGETMVVDWGLGKDLAAAAGDGAMEAHPAAAAHETAEGAVMGTPAFMPPEQAHGDPADERADVYALGAILYTLLAGRPPYGDGDLPSVLEAVIAQSAPPLDAVQPGVPPDLVAIVAKAMAQKPRDRYADASELARDLKRFQSGQLVGAHHYSRLALVTRWIARHRVPVTLTTIFVLALATVGIVAVRRVLGALALAERERERAEARGNEAVLAGARATLDRNATATLAWLKQYPANGGGWNEARVLALEALASGAARAVLWPADRVSFFGLSPDGTQFAVQAQGTVNRLDLRDATTGALVRSLPAHDQLMLPTWTRDGHFIFSELHRRGELERFDLTSGAHELIPCGDARLRVWTAISPDGKHIAVGQVNKTIALVDLDGKTRTLETMPAEIADLDFIDGGHTLAFIDRQGDLELWNLDDDTHRRWPGSVRTEGFSVSPDQQHIVSFGERVVLWSRADGQRLEPPGEIHDSVIGRWSADGSLIAIGGIERVARVWDWRHGTVRELAGHERGINTVAFSRDGKRLATGSRDTTARVWDLASGESIVLRGHASQLADVRFSADGTALVSVSADQSLRVWALPDAPLLSVRAARGEAHTAARVDGDRVLVTDFESGTVELVELATGQLRRIGLHRGGSADIFVSPDGLRAATDGNDGEVAIYDLRRGVEERRLVNPGVEILADGFSCDGRALLVHETGAGTRLVDLTDGSSRVVDEHSGRFNGGFFSPDCRRIFTQDSRGFALHVHDRDSGAVATWPGHGNLLQGHVFSADGKWLLTGDRGGLLRLWNLADGSGRDISRLRAGIESLATNGRLAAVGDRHGDLGLYDFVTGSWRALPAHSGHLYGLDFSPDGKRLVSGGGDRMLRLWDPESLAQLGVFAVGATVTSARFSRDGERVIATDNTGMLRVWRAKALAPATQDPAKLRAWVLGQTSVELLPDRTLASP